MSAGWGTAGNFPFLRTVLPQLLELLSARPNALLRLVSNQRFGPLEGHPQVEQIAWTKASELGHLRAFDVGIMPLDDTPLTRGKCGFKMIQYMAVGTPAVAADVGANRDIVPGPGHGAKLVAPGEWTQALVEMLDASSCSPRPRMGAAARARIEANYSILGVLPRYLELFRQVATCAA